jgi:hypothetical protein
MHNDGFYYKGTGSKLAPGLPLTGKNANRVTFDYACQTDWKPAKSHC